MNFTTLPPEIISGHIHGGPGSASMAEAATAWTRLATRLHTAVADYRSVTSKLAARCGDPTPASAAPYVDWLNATAIRAEEAATGAAAAVSAHRTVLAATVPPAAIAANRALRAALVLADPMGLGAPAVAHADAEYDRMWAQNAAAMYAYAAESADAAALTPFALPPGSPSQATWALRSAPEVVSAGRQVIAAAPGALRALSVSPLATLEVSLASATCPLSQLSALTAPSGVAIARLNSLNKAAALRCLLTGPRGVRAPAVAVAVGRAAAVGGLAVPRAWTAAAAPMPVYRGTVA